MTFEELEKWGEGFMKKAGIDPGKLVTTDTLKSKEAELAEYVKNLNGFTAKAALQVPYLNREHEREFGSQFDPEEFLKQATEKQRFDLKDFYEKDFVVEKRQAKRDADHKAEIDLLKAEAEAREKKAMEAAEERMARMQSMGPGGQSPADAEGPQMGAFQRKMLKMDKPGEGSGAPEVPLGEGGIAAFAAREFVNKLAGR
jgi:hypothetical protein